MCLTKFVSKVKVLVPCGIWFRFDFWCRRRTQFLDFLIVFRRLLVDGPLLPHVLIDEVVGLVLHRLRAGQGIPADLAIPHLLGGNMIA